MLSTADRLEKIPFLASSLIISSGEHFQIPKIDRVKLAELVMETYVLTCALSRFNKSCIVGNLHAEHQPPYQRTAQGPSCPSQVR